MAGRAEEDAEQGISRAETGQGSGVGLEQRWSCFDVSFGRVFARKHRNKQITGEPHPRQVAHANILSKPQLSQFIHVHKFQLSGALPDRRRHGHNAKFCHFGYVPRLSEED